LREYPLSSPEGLALMGLAEALLRVPDAATADLLIRDKLGDGDWARHRGKASSGLINAATAALALSGRVLGGDASPAARHGFECSGSLTGIAPLSPGDTDFTPDPGALRPNP